jgi:MFS family permease
VRPLRAYVRSLDPGLSRDVWLLQGGSLLNAFGNGVVLPFLIIYLHNVRGIALGLAGLIAATNSAAALCSGFVAGSLSDRLGPKRVLVAALCVMAVAISLFPFIRETWHALALNALLGTGSGAFWPSQSAMVTALTSGERRHSAYAIGRVTMNLGVALGGVAGGLIASTAHPGSFTVLFVLDACTFVGFAVLLSRLPSPRLRHEQEPGTYLQVVRDRVYMGYVVLNSLFIAGGIAVVVELLPPFAKNNVGVNEREIGVLWAVNSLVIVLAQLPIAKLAEGRRRMRGLALMGLIWITVMLGVGGIGLWLYGIPAAAALAACAALFGLGECLHGTIHLALAADLARPGVVGRYLAFSSQSWQIGWIVGPACGGFILQHAPLALWPAAAGVNLVAVAWALLLETRLPRTVLLTPSAPAAAPEPSLAAGPSG